MKLLYLGDVVGRSGRDAVIKHLPTLKKDHKIDATIVCSDNAAGGFGVTAAICRDFLAAGTDVVTGGDHIWDQKDVVPYLSQEKRLLRPQNFPEGTPGSGHYLHTLTNGKKILVIHLLGQVFHKENAGCPFAAADTVLETYKLGSNVDSILVDMHCEATSEKNAMGRFLDGRVSLVVGSHTHIPTADARILNKGTAYQTDAGMCGDYDSVIGFEETAPLKRFISKLSKTRLEVASGPATLCGCIVETDDATGLAISITQLQYPESFKGTA